MNTPYWVQMGLSRPSVASMATPRAWVYRLPRMARAGSPGMSRSRKNVTSVMPKMTITRCTSRRGSIPKRFTGRLLQGVLTGARHRLLSQGRGDGRRRPLVRVERQRLERQVVVAERSHLEPVHQAAHAVPVGAV